MKQNRLGRTGLMVSAVGMGGIPVQRVDFTRAAEVTEYAISQGINFFDTARAYTDSEAKLGEVLGRYREKVIIATKTMARDKGGMASDIDVSLQTLKVDYIDLYQLHNVKDDAALTQVLGADGALAALKQAQKVGKIRFIGITGHIPDILVKAVRSGEFDTVQFPFNPIETGAQSELLPLAKELDLGIIAMKPFAGGAIRNKAASLKFILAAGFSIAIPGMEEVAQVEENTLAAGSTQLTKEEEQLLDAEIRTTGERFCRRCEYCQPCRQGIDIPTVFLLDGYWTRYGLQEWAVERYKYLQVKADECIDCGRCEERCPYQLPIREMLKEAAGHFGPDIQMPRG